MMSSAKTRNQGGDSKDDSHCAVLLWPECTACIGKERCQGTQERRESVLNGLISQSSSPTTHCSETNTQSAVFCVPVSESRHGGSKPRVDLRDIGAAVAGPSSQGPYTFRHRTREVKQRSMQNQGGPGTIDSLQTEVPLRERTNSFKCNQTSSIGQNNMLPGSSNSSRRSLPSFYTHRPAVSTIIEESSELIIASSSPSEYSDADISELQYSRQERAGQCQAKARQLMNDGGKTTFQKEAEEEQALIIESSPNSKHRRSLSLSGHINRSSAGVSNHLQQNIHQVALIISIGEEEMPTQRPSMFKDASRNQAGADTRLASLPALIQRATRLAAFLDREPVSSRPTSESEKGSVPGTCSFEKRSNSLSDMLASFPPPCVSTPTERDLYATHWPSSLRGRTFKQPRSSFQIQKDTERGRGKYCGSSPGSLSIVIGVLIIVIAAAIIVPLLFTKLRHEDAVSHSITTMKQCQNSLICQNGGLNWLNSNLCRCLCLDGFSGERCEIADAGFCSTAEIAQDSNIVRNVTFGSSIPQILRDAGDRFGIYLNSSALLQVFSATNLSCAAENALVAFNGKSTRFARSELQYPCNASMPLPPASLVSAHISNHLRHRRARTYTVVSSTLVAPTAVTSNGIILAAPTATTPSTSATPALSTLAINNTVLDFARVSVLFVLQQSMQLNVAVIAQDNIQSFLGDTSVSTNGVVVTGSIMIDFINFQLRLGNGTLFGRGA
ncbi:hypothetical protein L228DRAFT_50444 [Xylona heveae TC161]|uniref:EGF-like domain-containing protein n=1 Tax=Xylona heveae (strain CBS 132557 / TC161) TaxID=1328760 RepID=A0A164ZN23_XYLHT|nr:hypothetical protein L228DRAFT_50444 [Xylona heveae TC161]KZF19298.1 hypothetical protein L228DRAFT_50444 [Xylona heveae TC161]